MSREGPGAPVCAPAGCARLSTVKHMVFDKSQFLYFFLFICVFLARALVLMRGRVGFVGSLFTILFPSRARFLFICVGAVFAEVGGKCATRVLARSRS